MLHPPSLLVPFLLPTAQICVVSLYNSHYGGVRFGAEASEWLSCLSGSLPNQLYCYSPRAVPFQTETLACTPLVVPPTVQQQPVSYSNRRSLVEKTLTDQLTWKTKCLVLVLLDLSATCDTCLLNRLKKIKTQSSASIENFKIANQDRNWPRPITWRIENRGLMPQRRKTCPCVYHQ